MAKKDAPSLIADNRKARHDFNIHETYEAGIALTGTEIKSINWLMWMLVVRNHIVIVFLTNPSLLAAVS